METLKATIQQKDMNISNKGFSQLITAKVRTDDNLKIEPFIKSEDGFGKVDINNKLQLLKYTSEVQSRIKDDISSDFVLAKLGDKDKEGIIEMTGNAYFFRRLCKLAEINARRWVWNEKEEMWNKRSLNQEERNMMSAAGKVTFDTYMVRIYMTVILNRNVNANYLISKLSQYADEEDIAKEEAEKKDFMTKMKEMVGGVIKPTKNKPELET